MASTMKSQRGKGRGGIGPEETLIARPLGGGNDGAGRRSEDDPNLVTHALTSEGHDASEDGTGRGTPLVAATLKGNHGKAGGCTADVEQTYMPGRRREDDSNLVAVPIDIRNALRGDGRTGVGTPGTGVGEDGDPAFAVTETAQAIASRASVRRLTPTEAERLQALPDGWTQLGDTPDSRRYAALGDAVTASVAEWIGHQLMQHVRARSAT